MYPTIKLYINLFHVKFVILFVYLSLPLCRVHSRTLTAYSSANV